MGMSMRVNPYPPVYMGDPMSWVWVCGSNTQWVFTHCHLYSQRRLPRSGMALDEIGRRTVASARPDAGMPPVVSGHNLN
jgi:hypothetical protein